MPRRRKETPELVERENGVWYVHWYDADKRRTLRESLETRDYAEALKLYAEFLLGGEARRVRSDALLTVSQALDDYWRQHVNAKDDRGRTRVVDVKRVEFIIAHLKAYFGDRPLKEIGPAESRGYTEHRRKQIAGGRRPRGTTVKDSTIRKELATLVAAANHALRWRAMPSTDAPHIDLPHVEAATTPQWFTKEQIQALLAATEGDLNRFIRIAYYTGARRRSIENLTPFQVKMAEGAIYLQPPDGRVTRKRRPAVPIFPEIRGVVRELLERKGKYLFGAKAPNFYPGFIEACEKIGVEGHPHMLRHSRASHMLQDGEDIWKVARLLGDTVATVERVYAHCLPHNLLSESNVEALPRPLAPAVEEPADPEVEALPSVLR